MTLLTTLKNLSALSVSGECLWKSSLNEEPLMTLLTNLKNLTAWSVWGVPLEVKLDVGTPNDPTDDRGCFER